VLDDLLRGVLFSLAYAAVGTLVLAVGYVVLDAITPGSLRHLVYTDHNRNAAILVSANVLALATIVVVAIRTASDDLGRGVIEAGVYGLLGVLLLALSFKVIDALTPGHLGTLVTAAENTPSSGSPPPSRSRSAPCSRRRSRDLVTALDVPPQAPEQLALPVGRRAARVVLLAAVFLCAACGLVYELALITLGQYLVGGTVYSTSLVLGVFVCAMGLGSLASKPLLPRAAAGFAAVELTLALAGGLSVLGLYAAYSWLSLSMPALIGASVLVGGLIGPRSRCSWRCCSASARRTPGRRPPTCSPPTTSARSPAGWRSRSCCCRCSARCAARLSSRWSTCSPRWSWWSCSRRRCRRVSAAPWRRASSRSPSSWGSRWAAPASSW
jgi:uncharacterized membrane protein YjfL (UPF0719 family)